MDGVFPSSHPKVLPGVSDSPKATSRRIDSSRRRPLLPAVTLEEATRGKEDVMDFMDFISHEGPPGGQQPLSLLASPSALAPNFTDSV